MDAMNSLPTVVDYRIESENNNAKVTEMMGALFPDLNIPFDILYELVSYLNETKVNAEILPRVIRGVHNITIGTGTGQVIVHVKEEKMGVSIREQDRQIQTKR